MMVGSEPPLEAYGRTIPHRCAGSGRPDPPTHASPGRAWLGWFRVEDVAERSDGEGTIYLAPDKESWWPPHSGSAVGLLGLLKPRWRPVTGPGARMSAAVRLLAGLGRRHRELSLT